MSKRCLVAINVLLDQENLKPESFEHISATHQDINNFLENETSFAKGNKRKKKEKRPCKQTVTFIYCVHIKY